MSANKPVPQEIPEKPGLDEEAKKKVGQNPIERGEQQGGAGKQDAPKPGEQQGGAGKQSAPQPGNQSGEPEKR